MIQIGSRFRSTWLTLPLLFLAQSGMATLPAEQTAASRPKVGLVLSGGGARGGAHIGVLEVLDSEGIPIDFVVGTSFGALVGGLYSVGYSPADLALLVGRAEWDELLDDRPDRNLLSYNNKKRLDRGLYQLDFDRFELELPQGLQAGQNIKQLLDRLTAEPVYQVGNDYDQLRIPFRAVSTDLLTGRAHIFRSGPLSTAIRASIAVPGLFTPVEYRDTLLVDGGIADNLPVDIAVEWGADIIIAVDVSTPLKSDRKQIRSLFDVLDQTIAFRIEENRLSSLEKASLVIQPELSKFNSSQFDRIPDMISVGAAAARGKMAEIRRVLSQAGITVRSAPTPELLDPEDFDPSTFSLSSERLAIQSAEVAGGERYGSGPVLKASSAEEVPIEADVEELDEDVSRIFASNLYRSVGFEIQPDRQGARLTYRVSESPRSSVGIGLRYDRDFKFSGGFDLHSREILDSNFDLISRLTIGDAKDFDLELDSGSHSGTGLFFSAGFDFTSFDRLIYAGSEHIADFRDRRYGGRFALNRSLTRNGKVDLSYSIRRVEILRGVPGLTQEDPEIRAGLKSTFHWDSYDRGDFPSTGQRSMVSVEWIDRALGSDHSFLKASADYRRRFQILTKHSLSVGGHWAAIDGGAPFYDLIYTGGAQYLDFASTRFIGLRRDRFSSKQSLILDLSYRHQVAAFQLGVLKGIYANAAYNIGWLGAGPDSRDLGSPLHGYGFGASLDIRLLGPVRFLLSRAENEWTSYFSIGYGF